MKKILSILKRIRLSSLLLLIVLLSFSSYAWMVFVAKVSTGLSAHVTAWDFDFKLGEDIFPLFFIGTVSDSSE